MRRSQTLLLTWSLAGFVAWLPSGVAGQSSAPATRTSTATRAPATQRTTPARQAPVRQTPAPAAPATPTPGANVPQPAATVTPQPIYVLPGGSGQPPNWSAIPGPSTMVPQGGVYGGMTMPQPGSAVAPAAPAQPGGAIWAPTAPAVKQFTIGSTAMPANLTPPPPSILPGPEGTYRLESMSGERLYLTGGLKTKLAGIVYPKGVVASQLRTTLRELVRTASMFVKPEAGSPPVGDDNFRAFLKFTDGRDLSRELVARGLATVNARSYFQTPEERDQMLAAQLKARQAKLGVWKRP